MREVKSLHISKNVVSIFLVFIFLCSSFSVALQNNLGEKNKETSILDNIHFDESFRIDYSESYYDFYLKNETMKNHSYLYLTTNDEYDSFNMTTDNSISSKEITVDSNDDALMDSCWPMKSQNRRHTGLSLYTTPDSQGRLKWTYKASDYIEGGIVIDDEGVLYFGDFGYYLRAVYPNGSLKWRFKTGGWIWSTPALASDGTVYVGVYERGFYAINPDGTLKWRYAEDYTISSSPAIAEDGTIYFGTMSGSRIVALNPDGTLKWEYKTGQYIVSDPAIADDGTIYIGSADSYLYSLNPDGSLKWRFKTGDIVKSHPSIADDGTIYFDSFDGYFYALNPDGTLQWKSKKLCGNGAGGFAIDDEGIIYVGGWKLSAVYPNGTEKWRYNFDDYVHTAHSTPVVSANGIVYVGVSNEDNWNGYIYAINSNDGSLKWTRKIANFECDSSPAIAKDGTVYIGSSSDDPASGYYGKLYAFCSGEVNNPPVMQVIEGADYGKIGESYTYRFTGSDPDGDMIYYQVNWGDLNETNWLGPYESGVSIELSHSWGEMNSFRMRARVKDGYSGGVSDWMSYTVVMPKNRLNHGIWIFLDWLCELFPQFEFLLDDVV